MRTARSISAASRLPAALLGGVPRASGKVAGLGLACTASAWRHSSREPASTGQHRWRRATSSSAPISADHWDYAVRLPTSSVITVASELMRSARRGRAARLADARCRPDVGDPRDLTLNRSENALRGQGPRRETDMRAIVVPRLGGPEVLELREVADPVPAADQVVVAPQLCRHHVWRRLSARGHLSRRQAARRQRSRRCRSAARAWARWSRSAPTSPTSRSATPSSIARIFGLYAERVAVPAWKVIKLPLDIDARDAAAMFGQGVTAHYLAL